MAKILKSTKIDTPIGQMIAIGDEHSLYFLEFADKNRLEERIVDLEKTTNSKVIPGESLPLLSIEEELQKYFIKKLVKFKTPTLFIGTDFQKKVWMALCKVPYGETRSYAEQAALINQPTAYRAVANANGRNKMVIVIPCHRIITSQGTIGGYGGGVKKKLWLLEHEQNHPIGY